DPGRPGLAYAVWFEYPIAGNAQPVVDQVMFARTTDAARTWAKPASIYSGNDEAQENQLLMTAGGVLLDVFVEGSSLPGTPSPPPLPVKIRVMRSTNQGQTWSPPIDAASFTYTNAVDPGNGGQLRFFGQQITAAAAGNAIYIAWFEVHKDFSTILLARSISVPRLAEAWGRLSATTWAWSVCRMGSLPRSSRPGRKAATAPRMSSSRESRGRLQAKRIVGRGTTNWGDRISRRKRWQGRRRK